MSADFICCGVHVGWRCVRSAATPAMWGAEKLVPSRTANWSPANSGSVDERICAPGAVTSGLSACPNGVSPDEVKLVGTPAQVVGTSSDVAREAHRHGTARGRGGRADPRAVEVRDRPAGERGDERERRVAGSVLGDDDARRTCLSRTGRLHAVRTAAAADERDRAAQRARGRGVAKLPADTRDRADVDEPLVAEIQEGGMVSVGTKGMRGSPPGATTWTATRRRRARSRRHRR